MRSPSVKLDISKTSPRCLCKWFVIINLKYPVSRAVKCWKWWGGGEGSRIVQCWRNLSSKPPAGSPPYVGHVWSLPVETQAKARKSCRQRFHPKLLNEYEFSNWIVVREGTPHSGWRMGVYVDGVTSIVCRVFFPHDLDAMAGRVLAEGAQQ